ncbi:MAG: AI-2E family transporter [Acidobacteriota bacterium]
MEVPDPRSKLARRFFFVGLLVTTVLFLYLIRLFLLPILLAAVFATLFFPLYQRTVRMFRNRRALASAACCFLLLLGLLLPIYAVAALATGEVLDLYEKGGGLVRGLMQPDGKSSIFLHDLQQTEWFQALRLDHIDWQEQARDAAQGTGQALVNVLSRTSRSTLQGLITAAITVFTMFYFFLDGERMVARLKYLSPLSERHENAIILRFAQVARATVSGTVIIALIQGTLGALVLAVCGIHAPVLWGVVMVLLAFIPLIGVKLVLMPAALIELFTGEVWQGVFILVMSFAVILNVDNVLRPRLVGQRAHMHDLVIFFSTLGGLATFGVTGIIVGPVIAAFFVALLDIYAEAFHHELGARPASSTEIIDAAEMAAPADLPRATSGHAL